MRNNIQFRYELMPYLYTLMYNATVNGIPMNTPVYFNYYTDNNTLGLNSGNSYNSLNEYDFLVGDFLLAAPVYTQGSTTRTVYLPWPDDWYYYPTGVKYGGGQTVTVNAPLGTLPLFMRGGAIIPMGPSMQYANQFQPGYKDINCWPEGTSSFTSYEDAGDGWDFTNGVYAMTTYTSSRTSGNWIFTIGARQGSYNPYGGGLRTNNVYVYNPQPVMDVLLNGTPITNAATAMFNAPLPCWFMTTDGKLAVRVIETTAAQTIQVDWNTSDPYNSMTVAGTFNGWNQLATNMTLVASNTWQGDLSIGSGTNFQFKFAANNNWSTNWGGTTSAQTLPMTGVALLNSTTNILQSGGYSGLYQFTFNDQTLAYSVTPLLASPYSAIYVPGTYNGWSPSNNVMQLVSDDTWQSTISFTSVTNLQFKFAANGTWGINWGENNGGQTQFALPLSGTAAPNSPPTNIVINGVLNGQYQFTFNDQSLAFGVQLLNGDSVGDGISDAWRIQYFSNISSNGTSTNSLSCATCDADGTGQNNLFKYLAGLDPTNPASLFMITAIQPSGSDDIVSFTSVHNKIYMLESTDGLTTGVWATVTNNIPGIDGIAQVIDPGGALHTNHYYRARLQTP
jgi:hypothetical protein